MEAKMASSTDTEAQFAVAQQTFGKFMAGLKWGGIASFLIAALVVYLVH